MEKQSRSRDQAASDRDLAIRFGSVMLSCLGSQGGGAVVRAIDESGLTFTQMKALITIGGEEAEPATVKLVAEQLGISLASASRAVHGLVKRELATRVEDPDDRRVRRVSLTRRGRELADRLMAARLEGLERFIESLTAKERQKLDAALALLLEREEIADVYRTYKRRFPR